jgi:hypothetical protein
MKENTEKITIELGKKDAALVVQETKGGIETRMILPQADSIDTDEEVSQASLFICGIGALLAEGSDEFREMLTKMITQIEKMEVPNK